MAPAVDWRGESPGREGVSAVGGGVGGRRVVVDADTPAGQGLDKYDIYGDCNVLDRFTKYKYRYR